MNFQIPSIRLSLSLAASLLVLLPLGTVSAQNSYSLKLDGTNDYVTMGQGSGLCGQSFTIECWFKRTGTGVSVSTGTGGVTAYPLVAKGRGEADGNNKDMNYFLGIKSSGNVLVADFEEGATGTTPGLNHPIQGVTPISNNVWYHAAAVYDGSVFRLQLNGLIEAELIVDEPPRFDSIQHASIGSALTSTGSAAGYFNGLIDEVRIWNSARGADEVAEDMMNLVSTNAGLVGNYSFEEGNGTSAANSGTGSAGGTLTNGATWDSETPDLAPPGLLLAAGVAAPNNEPTDKALDLGRSANTAGVDFVDFGNPPAASLTNFTMAAWVKRQANGTSPANFQTGYASPDPATIALEPIISKGQNVSGDANYYLGLKIAGGGVAGIAAGFETSSSADAILEANSAVPNGTWVHLCATFDDGTNLLSIYQDGSLLTSTTTSLSPVSSASKLAAGTSFNSTNVAGGKFNGCLDDIAVWNTALSAADIHSLLATNYNTLPRAENLVGLWRCNQTSGSSVLPASGTINGTITGPTSFTESWVADDRRGLEVTPSPADNTQGSHFTPLSVTLSNPNGNQFSEVNFFAQKVPTWWGERQPFTIVLLPDTQHYCDNTRNAPSASPLPGFDNHRLFNLQCNWIVANRNDSLPAPDSDIPIIFVSHLGDIVEHRDEDQDEWDWAVEAMDILKSEGIMTNVTTGNHDCNTDATAALFDSNFGPSYFTDLLDPLASGAYGWMDNFTFAGETLSRGNKDNYELFEAEGLKFIILHLECAVPNGPLEWAKQKLAEFPDRRAIITTHAFLKSTGDLEGPGPVHVLADQAGSSTYLDGNSSQQILDELIKTSPQIFLVLNGHSAGESSKIMLNSLNQPVYFLCQDYQERPTQIPGGALVATGGDGFFRTLTFFPDDNRIDVRTLSPLNRAAPDEEMETPPNISHYEIDGNSHFSIAYDMSGEGFVHVGKVSNVQLDGGTATVWPLFDGDFPYSTQYGSVTPIQWYVSITYGGTTHWSDVYDFVSHEGGMTSPPAVAFGDHQSQPVFGEDISGTGIVSAVWDSGGLRYTPDGNGSYGSPPVPDEFGMYGNMQISNSGVMIGNRSVGDGGLVLSGGTAIIDLASDASIGLGISDHLGATAVEFPFVVGASSGSSGAARRWTINPASGVVSGSQLTLPVPTSLSATASRAEDVNDGLPVPSIAGTITVSGGSKPVVWLPKSVMSGMTTTGITTLTALDVVNPTQDLTPLNGISGVTYNKASGSLFLIRNSGQTEGTTFEYTTDGVRMRTIRNSNLQDPEAIEWLTRVGNDDIFAITEENHQDPAQQHRITLCRIPITGTGTDQLNRTATGNVSALTAYSGGTINNDGLESVCFDTTRGLLYYTAEFRTSANNKAPGNIKAVIFARSIAFTGQLAIGPEFELCSIAHIVTSNTATPKVDVSDMAYDALTDTILLSSHEGDKIIRITRAGTVVEEFSITSFTQCEGVALHPDGLTMWLAGETATANEFAKFTQPSPALYKDAKLLTFGSPGSTGYDFGSATSIINDGRIFGHAWKQVSEESFNGQPIVRAVQWIPDGEGGYLPAEVIQFSQAFANYNWNTNLSEISYWPLDVNNFGCVAGVAVHPNFSGSEKGWGFYDGLFFRADSLVLPDYAFTFGRIISVNDKFEFLARYRDSNSSQPKLGIFR